MKWRILLAVAIGFCPVADTFAVPDWQGKKKKPQDDREQVQGTWTAAFWMSGGTKLQGNLKLVVRGKRWVLTVNNDIIKGTLKMDPTQKVKTFDATVTEGSGTGITVPGIYRLERDTWTVCWSLAEPRPTEFRAQANSNQVLFILKRAKQ
jgi:uncharacterized protein (TIGR03067 family)